MKHVIQFNSLALLEHFLNVEGAECEVIGFSLDNSHPDHIHYIVIVEGDLLKEESENEQV